MLYSGDDNRFDYVYKFVSAGIISDDRAANMQLFARFISRGSMRMAPWGGICDVDQQLTPIT
jgi:hypothetical protein